jgi:hypothetical protein
MTIEVRGGKEWQRPILDQGLLIGLGWDPEHDHVRIAFSGLGIHCVWPWGAEEYERFAADLIDRVSARPAFDGDVWHTQGQLVHVFDPRVVRLRRHGSSISACLPRRDRHERNARRQTSTTRPGVLIWRAPRPRGAPALCAGVLLGPWATSGQSATPRRASSPRCAGRPCRARVRPRPGRVRPSHCRAGRRRSRAG